MECCYLLGKGSGKKQDIDEGNIMKIYEFTSFSTSIPTKKKLRKRSGIDCHYQKIVMFEGLGASE
jgi:hypothetical protein